MWGGGGLFPNGVGQLVAMPGHTSSVFFDIRSASRFIFLFRVNCGLSPGAMNTIDTIGLVDVKKSKVPNVRVSNKGSIGTRIVYDADQPTEEELATLRRIPGKIPLIAFSVAFVELCERFSFYGTTVVCKLMISHSNSSYLMVFSCKFHPEASSTWIHDRCWILQTIRCFGHGPASFNWLDFIVSGSRKMRWDSTDVLSNAFWSYIMPLLGAYMAEKYWGRFKTIQVAIAFALVGHVILIISALPPVIVHPNAATGIFAVGIIIMGVGVGGFKANISVLIAEQCRRPLVPYPGKHH